MNLFKLSKKILLIITIFLLIGCSQNNNKENFNNLLTIDILDKYYLNDQYEENNIIYEYEYVSTEDESMFLIQIFSHNNLDIINNEEINENAFIDTLTNVSTMEIDNEIFSIGYSSFDDVDDVVLRAIVRHNDYVFEFTMTNADDFLTEEQKDDFITMIKTIKFK